MTNLTINTNKGTIEMTKTFAKAASRFGSEEYNNLQQARKDYPNFKVVEKKVKCGDRMKGLTIVYMERYINEHPKNISIEKEDGTKETITTLAAFYQLCGRDVTGNVDQNVKSVAYGKIKKWFLDLYPEVSKNSRKSEVILSGTEVVNNEKVA